MDKVKYTIVGIIPSVQEALKMVRVKFGSTLEPSGSRYILKDTAHFTIKRTFYLKTSVEEVLEKLKEISANKIELSSSESGIFSNTAYGDVVYIKVGRDPKLIALHKVLKEKLDDLIDIKNPEMEGENYLPHITLSYHTPQDMSPGVKEYIDSKILPIEFTLNELVFLRNLDAEKDEWEVLDLVKLMV